MFGKMMNSFYYGKSGKGDYRKEDLPSNRWQLFFEMLKVRLAGLVRLNLIYMLILIPLAALIIMTVMAAVGQMTELVNESGEIIGDLGALATALQGLLYTGLVFAIPCIAITGPFTAGLSYVTRNWARDEHSFVWSDFKDAMKENWKQALIVSSITAVLPVLVYVGYITYGQMIETSGIFFIVPQVLLMILGVLWSLALIYIYPLMVSYKLTFVQLIRNAFLLAVGRLPQSLALRFLSLLPMALGVLVFFWTGALEIILLVMAALYALFLLAFNRFCYASYTNGVFDKYINAHIEGAQVNRGLSQEDDDDTDEGEE
jgi:Predicted integral membrane protein